MSDWWWRRWVVAAEALLNQANVYANTIGSIWMIKEGQYSYRNPGEIYLWDVPSTQSGFYANRE